MYSNKDTGCLLYFRFMGILKNTSRTIPSFDYMERTGRVLKSRRKNKWNAIVDPKDGELHNLKNMINDLIAREVKVTLNINNHYEGSAPMTIDRFLKIFLGDTFI